MAKKYIGATLTLNGDTFFATIKKAKSETTLLEKALNGTSKSQQIFAQATSQTAKELYSTAREQKKFISEVMTAKQKLNDYKTTAIDGFKKIGSTAIKGLSVASAGVTALAGASTAAYADYEQLVGGVETLFGAGGKSLEEYASSIGKTVDDARDSYNTLISSQNNVLNNAREAYKTAGLSANAYMETVTGFSASLLQSLGGDTKKAAEYANTAVIDMSDNANKMGTDISSIQNAYQGFAKQNYTMLDNLKLGYGGTKTEMERLLQDASKISGITYDISAFSDIVQAIHVVQDEMDITGTTAVEASSTIQGSLNSVKSAWTNVLVAATSGEGMEGAISGLVESAKNYIGNITPAISQALSGIGEIIKELAPVISAELPGLMSAITPSIISAVGTLASSVISNIPTLFGGVVGAVSEAIGPVGMVIAGAFSVGAGVNELQKGINTIKDIKGAFDTVKQVSSNIPSAFSTVKNSIDMVKNSTLVYKGVTIAQTVATNALAIAQGIYNAVLSANPVVAVIIGIIALIAAFVLLWNKCDGFRNFFKALWENIKTIVTTVWEALKTGFTIAVEWVKSVISSIATAFSNIKTKISETVQGIKEKIVSVFTAAVDKVKEVFSSIVDKVKEIWNKIKSFLKAPSIVVTGHVSIAGIETPIPKLGLQWNAQGGIMTRPTAFGIANGKIQMGGEAGAEAILPLSSFWNNLKSWTMDAIGSVAMLQNEYAVSVNMPQVMQRQPILQTVSAVDRKNYKSVNSYKSDNRNVNVDLDVNINSTDNRSGEDLADEVINALVPKLKRLKNLM